ncbi:MAG: M1 family metallopeptidase [Thermoanaerobaculia bacterium]
MRRFAFLSLFLAVAAAAAELPAWRLDPRVQPISQAVHLRLDPAADVYDGATGIALHVTAPAEAFRLHAEEMTIESLRLSREGREIPAEYEAGERAILHVRPGEPLVPGVYLLEIEFSNEYDRRAVGLYKMMAGEEPYLFTQFEAVDARKAFPTWDEPGFKYPWQLTITAPKDLEVVTNTPAVEESLAGEWRTIRFATTKPLPSYLVAIAVGELERTPIEGMGVPGSIWSVEGTGHLTALAAEAIPPILAAQERYFGSKYPYQKLDFIAIPEYWPGAMEHPGAITFSDGILLLDPERATFAQRRTLARVVSHELAHQWFGNLVTMEWWDDLWLNESFADWLGDRIVDELYPEFRLGMREMGAISGIMIADARPSAEPIRAEVDDPENVLMRVGLAYNKGKGVLRMIERWVGEDAFRRGVVQYLAENAWGNATASDFSRALARESNPVVPKALGTFLEQPGYPIVTLEPLGEGRVRVTQSRFHNAGVDVPPLRWIVPVGVRWEADGVVEETTIFLDEPSKIVRLALSDIAWIHPNVDGVGYYRWTIPQEMMLDLASAASERLTASERIAFLGNVSALLDAGRLEGDDHVRIVERFATDPEPLVVSGLMPHVGKIRATFVTPELEGAFAAWLRETFRPVLDRIGMAPAEGEDEAVTPLRAQLMVMLARDGRDAEVLARGRELAAAYLKDPSSVPSSLAGVALEIAAIEGDRALFDLYRRRFEEAATPTERERFLEALGAFEDPALVQAALAYALDGPLRPNEIFEIPFAIAGDDEGSERFFAWATANWDEITERMPPFSRPTLAWMGGGCSEERLERTIEYFERPDRQVPGIERQLERVADQVRDCVRLRAREGEAVAEYLRD